MECEEQREYTVGHKKAIGVNQRGDATDQLCVAAESEKQ